MRAFVSVVQAGSFSAAARRLGIGQSAVSKKVAALEKHFEVDLLRRNSRALSLTETGAEYYRHATKVLEQLDLAEASIAPVTDIDVNLRVTMSPVLSRLVMSELIAEFLRDQPHVRISLDLTERHSDLVRDGFDIAIRASNLEDSTLRARRLSPNPMMLAASEDYLQRHGEPKDPEELAEHSCLGFTRLSTPHTWRFSRGKRTVAVKVDPRYDCNQGDSLVEMASLGMGLVMMPYWVMRQEIESGRLRPVLRDWKLPSLPLYIIYSGSRNLPTKSRKFIDFIVQEVRERKLLPA